MKINFDGISLDGKKFKDWDSKTQEAFFEGFKSNTLSSNNNKAVYGTGKNSSKSSSGQTTDKFNIGNPDTDNGHCLGIPSGVSLQLPSGCRFGVFRSHTLTSTLRNSAGLH